MKFILLFLLFISLSLATSFISNCTVISKPGDYVLSHNLQFVPLNEEHYDYTDTCLRITSPNVNLDCSGHSIIGAPANDTFGIYSSAVQNISIKNCNISSFGVGVHLYNSDSVSLTYNSFSSSVSMGDGILKKASNILILNNVFVNSTIIGGNYSDLTVINNTFHDAGVSLALDSNSIFSNNRFNSDDLVYLGFYSYEPGGVVSNNLFPSFVGGLNGEGLLFANNTIPSSDYNGLDISRLKNSQLINNTICSPNSPRPISYTEKYFDLYGAWPGNHNVYVNNTCDTSNPQHICTKSCAGSDTLSKSNCPLSFILISFLFLAFLRGKN